MQSHEGSKVELGQRETRVKPLIEWMGVKEKSLLECLGLPLRKMSSGTTTISGGCVGMRMTSSKVHSSGHTILMTSMTHTMHGTGALEEEKLHGHIGPISPMLRKPVSFTQSTTST